MLHVTTSHKPPFVPEIGHRRVEVVECLGQRDRVHGGLSVLFRQVDDARPERHLDLDERLIAVGEQILGLARVDAHDTE